MPIILGANRPQNRFYCGRQRIYDFRGIYLNGDGPGPSHEPED